MTNLSDRMADYEDKYRNYLPVDDNCIMIRINGSNFSKLTKCLEKPYDDKFINLMNNTAKYVIENLSGFRFGTVQSDEINICLQLTHEKQEPFYGLNKIISLTAAYASSYFSINSAFVFKEAKPIQFDSRVFHLPKEEAVNYFIWRQKDTSRNAIQMAARTYFSHKQVTNKNFEDMSEMLKSIGKDFNNLPNYFRLGRSIYKTKVEVENTYQEGIVVRNKIVIDNDSPEFVKDKDFIQKHLNSLKE